MGSSSISQVKRSMSMHLCFFFVHLHVLQEDLKAPVFMLGHGFQLYRCLWHAYYSWCEGWRKRRCLPEATTSVDLNSWWTSETALWSGRCPLFQNRTALQEGWPLKQKSMSFPHTEIHVAMHTCIHTHTRLTHTLDRFISMYIYLPQYIRICIKVSMHIMHIRVCTYIHVHMHIHTRAHAHAHIYRCMHEC